MESYVIIIKDADGAITDVLGKRNGNAFNTEERAEEVLGRLDLGDGKGKVIAITPHDTDDDV